MICIQGRQKKNEPLFSLSLFQQGTYINNRHKMGTISLYIDKKKPLL